MDLVVTFIGTSASVPSAARGTSATLVSRGGRRWLVDCGEGTQRQLLRSGVGLADVDVVLLTHLHGDHFLGLPGMFKTFALRGREEPLLLIGPEGLERLMETLQPLIGRLPFHLEVQESGAGEVLRDDGAAIRAFHTDHGVRSLGYALVEDDRPGVFDVDAARALGVPDGPSFGVLQRGGEVTLDSGAVVRPEQVMGEARSGRVVVFSGDTRPCAGTEEAARGADLLIHEATFCDEDAPRAIETRHTTAREAGALAARARVRMLALTHVSTRVHPREVRREAEHEFPGVIVPRDFDQVEIPFRERGAPRLIPVQERLGKGAREDPAASDDPATLDRASL
ncbi:MAG: ribonuclease Z [Miltoncostaeaceae bacterium]